MSEQHRLFSLCFSIEEQVFQHRKTCKHILHSYYLIKFNLQNPLDNVRLLKYESRKIAFNIFLLDVFQPVFGKFIWELTS